jgi:Rrf2 family transcriptional regulator, iron-sulfur cluster assembly transcription factor
VQRIAASTAIDNGIPETEQLLTIPFSVSLRLEKHDANTRRWGKIAMFSRSAGYAVQALTYLAAQPSGKLTGAREIAEALQIPMPFLWKILRNLSRKKLVRSFKGVRGGYELARSAERISVSEILAASPDAKYTQTCVLGLDQCDEQNPCPLHSSWTGVRSQIDELLEKTSLADMARKPTKRRRKRAGTP